MKVSGFTFLRNAQMLGYPFVESIQSILPIVDEFIIALGPCEDNTEMMIRDIGSSKIKIIHTQWNEKMAIKGYVYAQQTNVALYNCTGDWAFYLQADEVIHENDIPIIRKSLNAFIDDDNVEALVFDFIHFYGNHNTYGWSPGFYRRESRILKNNLRVFFPSDGQFFCVLKENKKGRYPRAALSGAKIYHYGWVRSEQQMNLKVQKVEKYWGTGITAKINYADIDGAILKEFKGTHPKVMTGWLPKAHGIFKSNPYHKLTVKERRHRIGLFIENITRLDLSKWHFKLVK